MDYGEVLGRAWKIIWKHKILWIFGIFASFSRGGGGNGGSGNASRMTSPQTGPGGQNPFSQFEQFANQLGTWIENHIWVVVLFAILVLILIVLSIWLGTMGRIGLIRGTFKADTGAERLGFGELWKESTPFFWRVFLLSLLVGLAILVVLVPIILLGIVFGTVTLGVGLLCLIPFICILIPALILLGMVIQLGETGLVLENLGIMDGLRRGWQVFKDHIGPVLLIWLILAVIAFVVGIVIVIPLLVVLVPAFIAFFAGADRGANVSYTPLIVAGLCFVAYFPVLLVLNGILTAYLQSVWALTYLRLTKTTKDEQTPAALPSNA